MNDDSFGPMHGPILPEEPLEDVLGPMFGPERPNNPATENTGTTPGPEPAPDPAIEFTPEQQRLIDRATRIEHFMTAATALIIILPVALGLYFAAGGVWINWFQAFACFAASGLLAVICVRKVNAAPKEVAIRTWMGGRIPFLKQEGYCLVFPFIWEILVAVVVDHNTDLSQYDIPTKDGSLSVVKVSLTWHVDYKNPFSVMRYFDVNGLEGVEKILDDPTNQGVRTYAIELNTDGALAEKAAFRKHIIEELTKTEAPELREAFINGHGDLVLKIVGVEIIQLTVPDIVLPESMMKRRQEIANEKFDKKKETIERRHNIKSMAAIQDQAKLSPKEAAEFWLISQDKVKKDIQERKITVSGMEGKDPLNLTVPFQLLAEGLQGRSGAQNKGGKNRRGKKEDRAKKAEDDEE